jgi:ribosomal RNA assembly protein
MIKLIIDKLSRIIRNKKKLEETLKVKIENRGTEVYANGSPEDEYIAEKVILALDFGFPYITALEIKKEELMFEIINIKEYTNQKNLPRVRGRIIGKEGKTLKTISELSNCYLELKDNKIGIIGEPEFIKNAQEALISIIKGTKVGNVYAYLEKHHPQPLVDLGLKNSKDKL